MNSKVDHILKIDILSATFLEHKNLPPKEERCQVEIGIFVKWSMGRGRERRTSGFFSGEYINSCKPDGNNKCAITCILCEG